jgi:hypothetical protein
MEGNGGDFDGWPQWQAVAVLAASFAVPALLSAAIALRGGWVEAITLAVGCMAAQFALVLGVGFLALGYGPA